MALVGLDQARGVRRFGRFVNATWPEVGINKETTMRVADMGFLASLLACSCAGQQLGGAAAASDAATGGSGGATGGSDAATGGSDTSSDATRAEAGDAFQAPSPCPGDVVFPDPVLEQAVRKAIGVPQGPLSGAAVASLRELNAVGQAGQPKIRSLEGMACAISLYGIDVSGNEIADPKPLSGLPDAWILGLANNVITTLDGFVLRDLKGNCGAMLNLSGNPLTPEAATAARQMCVSALGWTVFLNASDSCGQTCPI